MTDTISEIPFNMDTYHQLLLEVSPRPITTEAEYDRLLAIAERYTFTGIAGDISSEERAVYKIVVLLIEDYESEHYPMDSPAPYQMLQHYMECRGIRQKDLVGIIGPSSIVSEVVNGKRGISKRQAKLLAEYFKVSVALFI